MIVATVLKGAIATRSASVASRPSPQGGGHEERGGGDAPAAGPRSRAADTKRGAGGTRSRAQSITFAEDTGSSPCAATAVDDLHRETVEHHSTMGLTSAATDASLVSIRVGRPRTIDDPH